MNGCADFQFTVEADDYDDLLAGYRWFQVALPNVGEVMRTYVSLAGIAKLLRHIADTSEIVPIDPGATTDGNGRNQCGVIEIITPYELQDDDHIAGSVGSVGIANFDNEEKFGGWTVGLNQVKIERRHRNRFVAVVIQVGYGGDWTLNRISFKVDLLVERWLADRPAPTSLS